MHGIDRTLMSRRGFCLCCLASTTFAASEAWLTPGEAYAKARNVVYLIREEAADAPITVTRLRGGVSVLQGSGGNIATVSGKEEKLLVDAGITASRPRIMEALSSLGPQPVGRLINTHWHFDHADGNEWLHSEGAVITAQEKTHEHLQSAQRVEAWDFNFPASPAGALPTDLMRLERTVKLNDTTALLKYYGPAHTDGDISVTFAEADILHTGDTFWNGVYPFIDYSTGGSIDGMIRAAEANVAAASDNTIVVPGHGPIGNKAQLVEFRDVLVKSREKIAAMKKQGRSLEEVVSAKPTTEYDGKWGNFVINPAFFAGLVYQGV